MCPIIADDLHIDTVAEANDMKVKIINNSTVGKKTNVDHLYVVVKYTW